MIEFASGQITGQRAAQEDALGVLPLDLGQTITGPVEWGTAASHPLAGGLVMVVADGMGGHVGGRIASTRCVDAFLGTVGSSQDPWDRRLEAGLIAANDALRDEAEAQPDLAGMGSTLVGAVIGEAGVGWISIGDSALYVYQSGELRRLNEDHSFGAYLDQQARDGLLTPEAARSDRRRNHLFYALLGDDIDHFERFSGFRALGPGDLVLVASDGLKTLDDDRLLAILAGAADRPIDELVATLLQTVERAGRDRQDNVSIIAARIGSGPAHPVGTAVRDAPTAPPVSVATPSRVPYPGTSAAGGRTWALSSPRLAILIIAVLAVIAGLAVGYFGYR